MLAYVFAHVPATSAGVAEYEDSLRRFHAALAAAGPRGFISSQTYRFGAGYSDWYLVEDSAALDFLNEAAVTGARSAPHDSAAQIGTETRFAKPRGMGYPQLYAAMEGFAARPGASLWRRMMVLGPPPEFCLVSRAPVDLPPEFEPESVSRSPI